MEFDPVIAAILAVIAGAFYYVYYLYSHRSVPLPPLASVASLYESELFTGELQEKEVYLDAKKAELVKAGRSPDEKSVSDVDSEGKKRLNGLLLKRAIAAIERADKINEEIKNVQALQRGNLLSQAQVDEIQGGIRNIEEEQKEIKAEADVLQHQWGASNRIFQQAFELSVGLQKRKDARRVQEEKIKEDVPDRDEHTTTTTTAAVTSPAKSKEEQKKDEEAKAKQAKAADAAFKKLMAEEERNEKKAGSKKGSKKG